MKGFTKEDKAAIAKVKLDMMKTIQEMKSGYVLIYVDSKAIKFKMDMPDEEVIGMLDVEKELMKAETMTRIISKRMMSSSKTAAEQTAKRDEDTPRYIG
jgi:hypothetical protein